MISSYRLGDLLLVGLNNDETNLILKDYPNSIGSKYILEKRNNINGNSIDIITKIILENMESVTHLLPKDIENSTVIHLRLGDVVSGNQSHEKLKRPFDVNHIKSLLINDANNKYVIGKCFFAQPSSTNYDECIHDSNVYLANVLTTLNATHFDSGDADIDLYCAIKSKLFVQGRGFFSKLIVEIRKKLNLYIIENICHD
jgi:hypothetical protein